MTTFGPGTLQIGETGSEIDASCSVNSLRITTAKDEGDSKTMLCGTVKPGKVTYTYSMTGNLDIDDENEAGLFALSQAEPGSEQPFTYTPNTAESPTATGTLVVDPMDFGGDEYGDAMNSDIEWTLVGKPEYTWPTDPALQTVNRFARVVQDGATGVGQKVKDTRVEPAKATPTSTKTAASSTKEKAEAAA